MRESELLEHVYATAVGAGPLVPIPPGDDMGMVTIGGEGVLLAVDQLVEGRHFSLETASLQQVGYKSVCRSLSDVAAMAAHPVAMLVAATLPGDFGADRATTLFDAMREAAEQYDCPLVGGDIAMSDGPLMCSVTVVARPGPAGAVRRGGALAGDDVYVTGVLGGSLDADGGGRHLTFVPRIDTALELAGTLGERLHAMIDLSDGLGRDAGHLAEQSGVQLEIDTAAVPCTEGCGWQQAFGDGEDYELCFTAAGDVPATLGGLPVSKVGRVVERPEDAPPVVACVGDERVDVSHVGWEHKA